MFNRKNKRKISLLVERGAIKADTPDVLEGVNMTESRAAPGGRSLMSRKQAALLAFHSLQGVSYLLMVLCFIRPW